VALNLKILGYNGSDGGRCTVTRAESPPPVGAGARAPQRSIGRDSDQLTCPASTDRAAFEAAEVRQLYVAAVASPRADARVVADVGMRQLRGADRRPTVAMIVCFAMPRES
jgi:hypothetical protein